MPVNMKVHSGLVGISNHPNARQRFFLASPEMPRLSTEFKGQFGLKANKPEEHHDVQPSVIRQEHQAVDKIKAAVLSHANEGNQLYNFITNAYVPEEHVAQILNADEIGKKLYTEYVAECINGCQSLSTGQKTEQQNVYVWKQEANCKYP